MNSLTTMNLGGEARYLTEATTKNDVVKAIDWARTRNLPFKVIGGGSNLIVTDKGYEGLIIVNKIQGIVATENDDLSLNLVCGAGEVWDNVVAYSVQLNLTGIEALSLVPGSVGATPVQNVGAYGQEVSNTIDQVETYDTDKNEFKILDKDDCGFAYRDSIFKSSQKERYIITGVSFRLMKGRIEPPLYESLQEYLDKHDIREYTPDIIREAVISVRKVKLPDPKDIANTGSFFKNPIVSQEKYDSLNEQFKDMPGFHVHDGIKVPAGWLLDHAGFKNYHHANGMGTHEHHALVLVNRSATKYAALAELKQEIMSKIQKKFDITLEQEPETL